MSYQDLLDLLLMATEEQLKQTVTAWIPDVNEFYPIVETQVTSQSDVLDEDHLYLVVAPE